MSIDPPYDNVQDACQRLGLKDTVELFERYFVSRGLEVFARHFGQVVHAQWMRQGYDKLDDDVKDFILRVCNREHL